MGWDTHRQALKGTGKGGKTSKGETRKIFTKDEPTNVDVNGDSEAPAADPKSQMSQADAEAQVCVDSISLVYPLVGCALLDSIIVWDWDWDWDRDRSIGLPRVLHA